jgi:hypothetical protein
LVTPPSEPPPLTDSAVRTALSVKPLRTISASSSDSTSTLVVSRSNSASCIRRIGIHFSRCSSAHAGNCVIAPPRSVFAITRTRRRLFSPQFCQPAPRIGHSWSSEKLFNERYRHFAIFLVDRERSEWPVSGESTPLVTIDMASNFSICCDGIISCAANEASAIFESVRETRLLHGGERYRSPTAKLGLDWSIALAM